MWRKIGGAEAPIGLAGTEVGDVGGADPSFERDVVEAGRAGDLVQGGVDVGGGVVGAGEEFHLPADLFVRGDDLAAHRRVFGAVGRAVEEGLGEVDEAHGNEVYRSSSVMSGGGAISAPAPTILRRRRATSSLRMLRPHSGQRSWLARRSYPH